MSATAKPGWEHQWGLGALDATLGFDPAVPFAPPLAPASQTSASLAGAGTAPGGPVFATSAAPGPYAGASNLHITVSFDTWDTANGMTQAFINSVNAAVAFFENHLTTTNAINLTLHVGYGEIGGWGGTPTNPGTPLGAGALGASQTTGYTYTYGQVQAALQTIDGAGSADQQAAAASLPGTDPTNLTGPNDFYVADAQAQALGLDTSGSPLDASIGFDNVDPVTWGTTNSATASTYDGFGTIEHEISETLGRTSGINAAGNQTTDNVLDLFRYSGANTRDLAPNGTGYFSIDNGATNLGAFNDPTNGGDAGDWANSVGNDSAGAFSTNGAVTPFGTLDLRTMNVLGYTLTNPCFAAGTRILTDHGEVPVEALAPGDRVITRFAGTTPIRWIGQRRIDCARHPDPALVRPIRVAPDAFGPGRPRRPLLLSPEHAVAIDGALVPIRLLVNGASIAQLTDHDRVVYFHIELDRHDLLQAEGLEAESYLDTGNRAMFDNAGLPPLLHPDPASGEAQATRLARSCLPFLADPAALEPRWRALAARSAALGLAPPHPGATTDDADLHLRLGARRIDPIWEGPDRALFAIPPNAGPARLASRGVVPAALRPWVEDRRRLGVMVKGLILRHGAAQVAIALDDPRLSGGWWAIERDAAAIWRWTDGAARLPVPQGGAVLELRLGERLAYPLPPARAA